MNKKVLFFVLFGVLFIGVCILVSLLLARVQFQYGKGYSESQDSYISGYNDVISAPDAYVETSSLSRDEWVNNNEGSKIQKNGDISFLVTNIDTAEESIKIINNKYTAEITNVNDYGSGNERVLYLTIKLPVKNFDAYYNEVREIDGEVVNANISTLDVTEEYIDITSRLENLRDVEEQLVEILQKAESVTDILAVQTQLNTVRGDIESYEQRKRYFDSQTDYAYITLSFSIDKTGMNITDEEWKPLGEFRAAFSSLISVFKGLINASIWILVFSPIILIPVGIIILASKRLKRKEK